MMFPKLYTLAKGTGFPPRAFMNLRKLPNERTNPMAPQMAKHISLYNGSGWSGYFPSTRVIPCCSVLTADATMLFCAHCRCYHACSVLTCFQESEHISSISSLAPLVACSNQVGSGSGSAVLVSLPASPLSVSFIAAALPRAAVCRPEGFSSGNTGSSSVGTGLYTRERMFPNMAILIPPVLCVDTVSYTHLRAHETPEHLVCRLLLEKKKKNKQDHYQ
eukprot:TRINITY_DN5377_c0_g1_i4.p1 TRINITY_DN5377_c0_g1~~TRINITY_DN5377_c0_g1_i4.p1  ORF type:complete len:219 (-),score=29.81 TRINITY_DN5377_c0_g1_i4:76-732(-)